MGERPRPVLGAMAALAAINVFALGLDGADLLPEAAARWVIAINAALQVGAAFYVQNQVTPLSDPRDNLGRPLIRAPIPSIRQERGEQ